MASIIHISGLSVLFTTINSLIFKTINDGTGGLTSRISFLGTSIETLLESSRQGLSSFMQTLLHSDNSIQSLIGGALTMSANMLASWAVTEIFDLAIKAIDNYTHRLENAKKTLDQSNSSFSNITSDIESLEKELNSCSEKIKEINSLGKINLSDDAELQKLQSQSEELERQIALKREEARLQAIDLANNAQKTYNVKVDSNYLYDNYHAAGAMPAQVTSDEELKAALNQYKTYAEAKSKVDAELADKESHLYAAQNANQDTSKLTRQIKKLQEMSDSYAQKLEDTRQRANEMSEITFGVEDAYSNLTDNGVALTEKHKKELASVQELNSEYLSFLNTLGEIENYQSATGEKGISDTGSKKNFNLADENTATQIDDYQSRLSALGNALEKLRNTSLSDSDLLDLCQQFPELAEATGNLDEILTGLIDGTFSDITNFLQADGAPSGLLDLFKNLADEAKGLASTDWSDTFNVFDEASSKMSNLSELMNALGNDYILTANEARTFAEVFPELLAQGELTSDGLIQFNQSVLDEFVDGKQAEINTDKEVQIAKLKNEKAVLDGKISIAQAELDLLVALSNSKIDAEAQENTEVADAREHLAQYLLDLGMDEESKDAAIKAVMAGNMQEYDRIVAEVATNTSSNLSSSASVASDNVGDQSKNMVDSLYKIGKQASNSAKVILSLGTGNPMEAVKEIIIDAADNFKEFTAKNIDTDFKIVDDLELSVKQFNWEKKAIEAGKELEELQKKSGDISAQIAILEASSTDLTSKNEDRNTNPTSQNNTNEFEGSFDKSAQSLKVLESELSSFTSKLNDNNLSSEEQASILDEIIKKQEILANTYEILSNAAQKKWDVVKDTLTEEQLMIATSGQEFGIKDFNGNEAEYNIVKDASELYLDLLDKQQKYNDQSLTLEQKRVEKYKKIMESLDNELSTVSDNKKDVQNELNLIENKNQIASEKTYQQLIQYSKEEIEYYEEKIGLAERELRMTKPTSARYYELLEIIQNCEDAISGCYQEQDSWNQAILEIPVKVLERENQEIDRQINKLKILKDEKDSAISGALDILDSQKEAFEKSQKNITSYYEEQIEGLNKEKDAIQEQVDALQQKNEEIDRTIDTEKKLAALEAAKQTKNKRILKNGEWTYDVDLDAIQNAQKEYDNQLKENKIAELEDQKSSIDDHIANLQNTRDAELDQIEQQVNALDEYRKKWEDISSAFQKEKNISTLAEQMGLSVDEVKQKLLAGDPELLSKMSDGYYQTEAGLSSYEEEKAHNEELIQTFESYVRAWQDGKMTIGEAKAAIQEIVNDNGIEIEAMTARLNSVMAYSEQWRHSRENIEDDFGQLAESEENASTLESENLEERSAQISAFTENTKVFLDDFVAYFGSKMDELLNSFSNAAAHMEEYAKRIVDAARESRAAERSLEGNEDKDDSSSPKSNSSSNSGGDIDYSHYGPGYASNHDGIARGLIGSPADLQSQENTLKSLTLRKLKPDEVIRKLQYKEAVLNQDQIKNLLSNINTLSMPMTLTPNLETRALHDAPSFYFGDINVTEAQNVVDIAKGIMDGRLEQLLMQAVYRRK